MWQRQLCCDAVLNLASCKGTLSAIDGQKVRCQLAGNGDRSLVAVAPRSFALVEHGQPRVESGSQMRGLQQHRLQMAIALLGDGHAPGVVGRGLLSARQAAVADDLLDGVEPVDLADFEHPSIAGMVINRSTRAAGSGSASGERSRARSVFWVRSIISRLSFSNGQSEGSISGSQVAPGGNTLADAACPCCS